MALLESQDLKTRRWTSGRFFLFFCILQKRLVVADVLPQGLEAIVEKPLERDALQFKKPCANVIPLTGNARVRAQSVAYL